MSDAADPERARRHSQKFIAFDTLCALHGQAEWQRFRRQEPFAFLAAKLEVKAGPPDLLLDVARHYDQGYDFLVWARWSAPRQVGCVRHSLRRLDIEDDGDFLAHAAEWMARDITRASGVETTILVRGNREAWNWHEDHKADPRPPLPRALRRRRVAGEFCGTCKARFRTEYLRALFYDSSGMKLPCGHTSEGIWEEEV